MGYTEDNMTVAGHLSSDLPDEGADRDMGSA